MSRPGQRPIDYIARRRWLPFRAGMRSRARQVPLSCELSCVDAITILCKNSRGSEGRGSRGGFLGAGARRDERAAVYRNCRRSSPVSSLSRQRRKTSSFEGDSPVRRLRGIAGGRRSGWCPVDGNVTMPVAALSPLYMGCAIAAPVAAQGICSMAS